jgi:hypothetical protein
VLFGHDDGVLFERPRFFIEFRDLEAYPLGPIRDGPVSPYVELGGRAGMPHDGIEAV